MKSFMNRDIRLVSSIPIPLTSFAMSWMREALHGGSRKRVLVPMASGEPATIPGRQSYACG